MINEDRIALRQLSSMLQNGKLHGGTIRQRAQFVVVIEHALAEPSFTLEEMKACALAMANWGDGTDKTLSPSEYFNKVHGISL